MRNAQILVGAVLLVAVIGFPTWWIGEKLERIASLGEKADLIVNRIDNAADKASHLEATFAKVEEQVGVVGRALGYWTQPSGVEKEK